MSGILVAGGAEHTYPLLIEVPPGAKTAVLVHGQIGNFAT
jgi:hypothetical protein